MKTPSNEMMWQAVCNRDSSFDGAFVFAVKTTGVYCRPSCPARRPLPENVVFFGDVQKARASKFRACRRCRPDDVRSPGENLVRRACELMDDCSGDNITLAWLGEKLGVSRFHLQRAFKAFTGITPKQYLQSKRISVFKETVLSGRSVSSAIYEAGFTSSSRLYEKSSTMLGMSPATYGRGGRGACIDYAFIDTSLGLALLAATTTGVCFLQFGADPDELLAALKKEYPQAILTDERQRVSRWCEALLRFLQAPKTGLNVPVDVHGTQFQLRVWAYLQTIPAGETRTYKQIAYALGEPRSARAVARACALNPAAIAIPCHRVVREDGQISGYRWGVYRKKSLLSNESSRR